MEISAVVLVQMTFFILYIYDRSICVLGGEIYDKIYTIFCTGFRPILDAMKSFAKDENPIDIEVCFQYHHINFRTAKCTYKYIVCLIVKLANHS